VVVYVHKDVLARELLGQSFEDAIGPRIGIRSTVIAEELPVIDPRSSE
jgi:hypothetical protein